MLDKNLTEKTSQDYKDKWDAFPPVPYRTNPSILRLEDAEIYYEVSGSGPAIIFAHGLGGNHLSWWQQIPYFSDRYTCINFSHRGFASSKNYSKRIGHSVFAQDLEALINHLSLNEVAFVAQSMGGWTSLTYTLKFPDKVKAVVMASSSGTIDFRKTQNIKSSELAHWEKQVNHEINKLKENGILNAIGFEMAKEQTELAYLYEQIYNLTPYEYKEFIRDDIKRSRNLSPEILSNLTTPFLFLTGDKDVLFPPLGVLALTSVMKNAKSYCFENSGHSVYFEKATHFNQIVDEFLAWIYGIPIKKCT